MRRNEASSELLVENSESLAENLGSMWIEVFIANAVGSCTVSAGDEKAFRFLPKLHEQALHIYIHSKLSFLIVSGEDDR